MEDNSQVWHLKAINKLLPSTEDQRSVSSFDTDDETNMIAAANSTRLHRLHLSQQPRSSESARNSRVSDVSRSRPFPAHQAVLDTLISSKSNGSTETQKEQSIASKSKQPISKDSKQASIRSSSNGLRKTEDKPRLAVFKPESKPDISNAKKLTAPTSGTDQKLPQVNLRRSHSKPGRVLMTNDDKYLKTANPRPNVTSSNHVANNVMYANCRSSFDLKNSKTKSISTASHHNISDVASKNRKFDDNDEFLLSPQSPQPPDDVIANVISAKTTTATFKTAPAADKVLDARRNCKLSKPADSIFKINNNRSNLLQPSTTSTGQSSPVSESPIVVAPPPQLLSIDSSRWKRSPASPTTDVRNVSCDVSSGLTRVNRRFSDKRDVSSTPTSDKDEASQGSQNDELRRLRQDLQWAKDQVTLLTSHLCTNTKVVEAFDSSLIKMLQKLHHLSTNSNNNQDLNRLIDTIEALRQQNINHCIRHRLAGYQADYPGDKGYSGDKSYPGDRSDSRGFVTSSYYSEYGYDDDDDDNSLAASEISVRQPRSRKYRHESETDISPEREKLGYFKSKLKSKKSRLKDTDSSPDSESKSVKQWLKNSFGRALSRIRTPSISLSMTSSSKKDLHVSSLPSIPLQVAPRPLSMDYHPMSYAPSTGHSNMTFARYEQRGHDLPSPSSALGSEVRGETRSRSNQRFASKFFQPLKAEIELPIRPATSLANPYHRRSDSSDQIPAGLELRANKRADGQHVTVSVAVDQVDDNTKQYTFVQGNQIQIPIGTLKVGDSMTWIVLDRLIKKTFEDHLTKLDPTSKLGMDGESILSYQVGEIVRPNDDASFLLHPPELLPIGYLIGDVTNICITLKGHREGCVDALAFELLISKASLSSYVHLLISHKRIILIGSSGTGKSHLAKRLACYMVDLMLNWGESSRGQFESEFGSSRDLFPPLSSIHHNHHHHHHNHHHHHHHQHLHPDKRDQSNLIAMYRVDSQSSRELRQYLNNMAVQYQDLYCRQEHLVTSSSSSSSSPSSSSTPGLEAGEKEIIRTEASEHRIRYHDDRASVTLTDVKRKSKENESETKSAGKSRNYRNSSTPLVIVLDNLHHVTSLGDAFCGFFDLDLKTGPYVIGTMQWSRTMATASSLNSSPLTPSPNSGGTGASTPNPPGPPGDLQFHHNFRWIIYSSKVDPVRGFLSRYLSRCFVASTVAKTSLFSRRSLALPGTADGFLTGGTPLTSSLLDLNLSKVIDWLPQAWQRINEYLEASSTRDITLGPRLFLSCPMEASRAHLWFVDLWNYSIVPYLMEALKNKNHQAMKTTWSRLVDWLTSSVPWKGNLEKSSCPLFLNFRPEDLGPFPTEQHNNRTGSNYSSAVTSEDKLRSKGQVDDGDDDDEDEVFNREASNDFSLDDIVSRFQAAAVKSSSSETGSVSTTFNLE